MTNDATPDLLVRTPGGLWRAPQEGAYGNEAQLRDLLAEQPSLIPGMTETSAAVTELTAPGTGSLDVAAISRAGEIALVECKLASNPEIRREVVGQLLAAVPPTLRRPLQTRRARPRLLPAPGRAAASAHRIPRRAVNARA